MKVVALVSGGKDSVLSMIACEAHGHEICCLANILPERERGEKNKADTTADAEGTHQSPQELDSHCFQTVGHQVIELFATCMNRPLRRATICKGQSVITDFNYDAEKGRAVQDEVEVLYLLLKRCVQEFQVEAVCSGAILSNYQRLRVENCCERLGLVSLGYLWQKPGEEVLDMVEYCALDARLVKVASMGLEPKKHLGKNLIEMRPHLQSLKATLHLAGEGGEFETTVLDCPLFKSKRIAMKNEKVIFADENPYMPTGHLMFDPVLVEKSEAESKQTEDTFEKIKKEMKKKFFGYPTKLKEIVRASLFGDDYLNVTPPAAQVRVEDAGKYFESKVPSFYSPHVHGPVIAMEGLRVPLKEEDEGTAQSQCEDTAFRELDGVGLMAYKVLKAALAPAGGSGDKREQVFYVMVHSPDMSHFQKFNTGYAKFFGSKAPPARAFIAFENLPCIMLDVYLHEPSFAFPVPHEEEEEKGEAASCVMKKDLWREVLHVQSMSPWAAASIGPYAQANKLQPNNIGTVLAGRIGMMASTLALPQFPMFMEIISNADSSKNESESQKEQHQQTKFWWEKEHASTSFSDTNSELRFLLPQVVIELAFTLYNVAVTLEVMGHHSLQDLTEATVFLLHLEFKEAVLHTWKQCSGGVLPQNIKFVKVKGMPKGARVEVQCSVWKGLGTKEEEVSPIFSRPYA